MVKTKRKFKVNDLVMAIDKGISYEAKILKVQGVGAGWRYFVHYQKWDRKHDAWVIDSLISAIPTASTSSKKSNNKKLAKKIDQDVSSSNTGDIHTRKRTRDLAIASDAPTADNLAAGEDVNVKQSVKPKRYTVSIETRPVASRQQVKALAESELCQDDDSDSRLTAKLNLPFQWKKFAVDEWSIVTTTTPITDRKLPRLPRANTLKDTMLTYLAEIKLIVSADEFKASLTFLHGLMLYFDRALPVILLFRQEREQYTAIQEASPTLQPCELYGCEHFNRLLVKFHRLMMGTVFPSGEESNVMGKLADFVRFVSSNMEVYFDLSDYVLAADAMTIVERPTKNLTNFFDSVNFESVNRDMTEPDDQATETTASPSPKKKRKTRKSR